MDSPIQILLSQLETLLIFLERPSVQRQLLALAVALVVAGALSAGTDRLLRRRHGRTHRAEAPHPPGWAARLWRAAGANFLWPVYTWLLVQLATRLFASWDNPAGMLQGAIVVMLMWWGYRLAILALNLLFGRSTVRPYRQRILLPAFLLGLGLGLLGRLVALPVLGSIELFSLLGASVTVGTLLSALFVLYVFIMLAWIAQGGLTRTLDHRFAVDRGVTHSIVTITRYTMIATGLLLALSVLGLDLSSLTIIGGGLSIGVGFGLQQIVANFISGLVLLFEQALRPGDVIDVDGEIGIVQRLNIRSTIVRTLDNVELIVPNEFFLTSRLRTYTKTSRKVRLQLPIGVSYGSDPHLVRDLMLTTAKRHGLVLEDPAPTVFFRGFGDSSLDFYLAVWLEQPDRIPRLRSDLYFMLWDAFKEHGITIPFPQRDLHLRTGWEQLRPTTPKEESGDTR